jgi:hypothetical protein
MWGQSAHVDQQRPGPHSPRPTADPFCRTVTSVNTVKNAGTVAPQPTETRLRRTAPVTQLPTRAAAELRHNYVNLGLIVCPLISGVFFGLVATLLLLPSSSVGHAFEVGTVAGAVICAMNAVALCVFMTKMSDDRSMPRAQPHALDTSGARAS